MSSEDVKDQLVDDATEENTAELDTEAAMQAEEADLDNATIELEERLRQADQKAADNHDLLMRVRADMENLRKRTQKDLENAHKYGIEKLVSELLPVIDSMELGLVAEDASAESMKEGMELTCNMLRSALEKFGVVAVNPENEKFNPDLHQAMSMQPVDDVEPNTVIGVMQKGYTLNERLVRPAMVMVSKAAD